MRAPTPFEREIGITIRAIFGINTKVVRFGDDKQENDVFIVSGIDRPVKGVSSQSSIGLTHKVKNSLPQDIKIEIVAASATETPNIDNLVASCVFESIKNELKLVYGACIPNIIEQYKISNTMKHATFVSPFLWEDLNTVEVDGEKIYFLMLLPISDAEKVYLEEKGIEALENLFHENQIDIFNINPPSVLS